MRAGARVVLALALLVLLAVGWRGQWAFQWATPRAPGGWLLLGATASLFVLWLVAARRPFQPTPDADKPRAIRGEWLAVAALCALAVFFRTVHFFSVPAGMNHDAAFNGMYALHVLQGAPYTPYVSAAWGRETLFMYVCTPLVAWLGNVPEAILVAGTVVGLATVPIFYLLARALYGRRIGLVALALLAVAGWHVVFSRVGWRMFMVPPFEMLALLGLWRALERGAWRDWVLTGVGAALAIYTYDAGRVVPVMVGVLVAVFMLIDRRAWRARVLGAGLALVTFLVVGAPMLWYAGTHFDQFKARAAHLAEQHAEDRVGWGDSVIAAAGMFNYRGNGNDFFIDEPLLEPLIGALFVFGALVVAWQTAQLNRGGSPPWLPAREARQPDESGAAGVPRTPGQARRPVTTIDGGAPRRAGLFVVIGLVLSLVPGVLSVPNGNRCIAALPFVYLIIAAGAVALADAVAGLLPAGPVRRHAPALLLAAMVAAAGAETYGEFLGAQRRELHGFSPEATAGGAYLRQFGDEYTRYVIAEDWPEYTLAYLSYNGGGTPLENQYVLGRRLEDIEDRINRYGRKGLVFVTDLKPAGRQALLRLQRLFAEHRVEAVGAPRLDGAQVATALIVDPQGAARTGAWANTTRALAFGGDAAATAVRCFDPITVAHGISMRMQLMRPQLDAPAAGEVRFLTQCPPDGDALLAVGFGAGGLEVRADHAEVGVAATALEAGHWYDVVVAMQRDGAVAVTVDGKAVATTARQMGSAPLNIRGIELRAPAGGRTFVDDITVMPGIVAAGEARWGAARRRELPGTFGDDFEATPFGLLAASGEWRTIDGPVSALASPKGDTQAPAAPALAGNAFDGGHGSGPGEFDQPVGISVDHAGTLFVADKANHRIEQFGRDGSFVRAWGTLGDQPGQFREPHDVAADAEFVYVADTWNQRVQVFDRAGAHVFSITGAPSMSSPRGVFVKDKLIYVAQAGDGRVNVYDRSGTLQRSIGTPGGDAPGHLVEPVDVAVDAQGDVWVVNSGNNRIEHFAADGTPRAAIPIPGWSGTGLKEVSLAVGADGTLYLSDWDVGGVRRFRPDGHELTPLGSGIRQPSGVALDPTRLLVVARAEDVVRVFPLDAAKPQ